MELIDVIRARWSPVEWDPDHVIDRAHVVQLLAAAQAAPSAGNSQPWSFLVGRRGDAVHRRILTHLAPGALRWVPAASMLVVNLSHARVEDTAWAYSEFSSYDVGQAVAYMTLQAQALGIYARQFRALDKEGLHGEFDVPPHWEVLSITALGAPARSGVHDLRALAPTRPARRSVDELLWLPLDAGGVEGCADGDG